MKRETYKDARARLLLALDYLGWHVRTINMQLKPLKVPYAITPKGDRIDFKTQAVYKNGRSLWIDIRDMNLDEFVKAVNT